MSFVRDLLAGPRQRRTMDASVLTWGEIFGTQPPAKSGVAVNVNTALRVSTVLGCCRVLAEGISQIPLRVLRKDGGKRVIAEDHPVHQVLAVEPNGFQTPFEFRETGMFHATLDKGFFAVKNRVRGKLVELLPLLPGNVVVKQDGKWNTTFEVVDRSGVIGQFTRADIFRVAGPSWNGYQAMQMVQQAKEAIGLSISTEESQARLHANAVRPSGLLSVDGTLKKETRDRLEQMILEQHSGVKETGKLLVLDNSAKFTTMSMTGVDAQTLESRKHQVEEVARIFRVFPLMLGYSDKTATFASAEQFFIAHVVHTLGPWMKRWEDAIAHQLFTAEERRAGYCARFFPQALLRGDAISRSTFYREAIASGWMTRNEARELEDLNPIDGLDDPLMPLNMVPVGEDAEDPEDPAESDDPETEPEDSEGAGESPPEDAPAAEK